MPSTLSKYTSTAVTIGTAMAAGAIVYAAVLKAFAGSATAVPDPAQGATPPAEADPSAAPIAKPVNPGSGSATPTRNQAPVRPPCVYPRGVSPPNLADDPLKHCHGAVSNLWACGRGGRRDPCMLTYSPVHFAPWAT